MRHKATKMASSTFGIFLYLLGVFAWAYAHNEANTLVLVDNLAIRESHSLFFKGLQGNLA